MKELVVISGKGGTGKTSITASFAALAERAIIADCDVDAADLHLVLDPQTWEETPFSGGSRAVAEPELCLACGRCLEVCRFDAFRLDGPPNEIVNATYRVVPDRCEGCAVCAWMCIEGAITMEPVKNGDLFVSDTRHGPMVHARLIPGEENSGKLVSLVRQRARELAEDRDCNLILIDGSPGIGCPVIASVTGADLVLIVVEPTVSGLHDFARVADLAEHFRIPAALCVNKHDLNAEMTARLQEEAQRRGISNVGRVRYDPAVTEAQFQQKTVVECIGTAAAEDIRHVWANVNSICAKIGHQPARDAEEVLSESGHEVKRPLAQ